MHNEGIAFGDVMSIRTFNLTIFPKISDFAALTSPNGHDVGAADTSIVHCALCIVHWIEFSFIIINTYAERKLFLTIIL